MLVFLSLLTLTVRYLSQSSTTTLSTFCPVGDGIKENGQSFPQLGQLNDDDAGNNVINILHLESDDEIDDNDVENEDIKWARMKDYNVQMSLIEECNPTSSSSTSSSTTSSSFNNNIITIRSSSSPTTVIQR